MVAACLTGKKAGLTSEEIGRMARKKKTLTRAMKTPAVLRKTLSSKDACKSYLKAHASLLDPVVRLFVQDAGQ